MSSQTQQTQEISRAPNAFEIHHALLRPVILQIMRAQGYHSSTPATVDAFTSLTVKYMMAISRQTAQYANVMDEDGVSCVPDIVDVRMALEDCGALKPEKDFTEQLFAGQEDTRGVDNFIEWATGPKNLRIRKVAGLDKPTVGDTEMEGAEELRETDYLSALKRKHNRTADDSKYAHTILGRGIIEPDPKENPIHQWAIQMHDRANRPPEAEVAPEESPRPASSGLSSLADEDVAMMDMDF
ncbi:uncharacterized protein GGS22DRAFT_151501 [Annulohypoxylon maeteangense]|uniref:uncharacterized protein n=1 Tax=Annulohypoxylon maeteangense TaxID=1927788 RepID=UPI0020084C73|nr:uncharacterized protein GGS22DRAFT_151501 [Annulohypoxylon maeteangense]KAI0890649.1 hypothetical protein GGS22DRAFT_151501 [Annulohypoxylon maeteangense]